MVGDQVVAVLRAVEGARSGTTTLDPLWTMPGHLAQAGPLTSSVTHLVDNARQSVTCSTFNFQRTSGLWIALRQAAQRREITVRVYVDANAADQDSRTGSPTTSEVAAHLRPAIVLRTKKFDGSHVRNHAKFLAVDHRFLLVTSANFSWSAEHGNIEFGVFIDNPNLTEAVERELLRAEDSLYECVRTPGLRPQR
jgi:phosphatidylserine/phosphatidylglycerophosphate/cardiolipin synthase-like enzyme